MADGAEETPTQPGGKCKTAALELLPQGEQIILRRNTRSSSSLGRRRARVTKAEAKMVMNREEVEEIIFSSTSFLLYCRYQQSKSTPPDGEEISFDFPLLSCLFLALLLNELKYSGTPLGFVQPSVHSFIRAFIHLWTSNLAFSSAA